MSTDDTDSNSQSPQVSNKYLKWLPLLLGPFAMLSVYIAELTNQEWFVSRGSNERIALILLAVPFTGFVIQAIIFRCEFRAFMAVLCGAFFCREWHFAGTSTGIYVVLAILAFWAVMRKDKFEEIIGNGHLKVWAWTVFAIYLLSQLIARRVFRYLYLPQEAHLHVPLEESVETMAHLIMIVTCFLAWKIKPARQE